MADHLIGAATTAFKPIAAALIYIKADPRIPSIMKAPIEELAYLMKPIGSIARTLSRTALLALACGAAGRVLAQPADPDRGRALYENHCQFCHTPRIHTRPTRLPMTRVEVRELVEHWRRQQNLRWTNEDTNDVVEYLNRTRYHFAD